jgi:hypothetical protein
LHYSQKTSNFRATTGRVICIEPAP